MDYYKHKLFLMWLVYIVSVVGIALVATEFGLLQDAFRLDRSHFSVLITIFYVVAELFLGWRIVKMSRELAAANEIERHFADYNDYEFLADAQQTVTIVGHKADAPPIRTVLGSSFLSQHIARLVLRASRWVNGNRRLDQEVLLNTLHDEIFDKNSFGSFASNTIILAGLVGTVAGIIMTFAPFMMTEYTATIDMTRIQSLLPKVFSGVGAAFYPSAVAAILALFISINDRLLRSASAEMINRITNVSETYVVPILERPHAPKV